MKLSLLKKIIDIPTSMVSMEVKDNTAIIDSLRELSTETGEPVYIWKSYFSIYFDMYQISYKLILNM